jgi:hypothetical protein
VVDKGKLAVSLFKDLNLILIPGDIPPPKYSFLLFLKSYVIQVHASIINTFSFEKSSDAALTSATLSLPNEVLVLYKLVNNKFVVWLIEIKLELLFKKFIIFSSKFETFEIIEF